MKKKYKYKWKIIGVILVFLITGYASAQITITGRVSSASTDEPLPGANVVVKGSTSGVVTDVNGDYTISVPDENSVLVFSFIGYITEEYAVGSQTELHVSLDEEITELSEVVVIGYGTQKREEVTTAITKVKSEDFVRGYVKSPVQLLQGKVAGLAVSTTSGDPTASVQMMIRGVTTLNAAADPNDTRRQEPLYVVDGIPGGSIYSITPEDIESIDVLKDGSAAAIYGTRGTNGVVLITTKGGKRGKGISVEYNASYNADKIYKNRDILTADDYIRYKSDTTYIAHPRIRRTIGQIFGVYPDSIDLGYSTDWVDEITRIGQGHVHSLSVNSANETSDFIASVTYRKQDGIMLNSDRESIAARFAVNHSALNDRVRFNFSIGNNNFTDHIVYTDAYRRALLMNPTAPVYDEEGNYFEFYTTLAPYNPVPMLLEETDEKKWVQTLYKGKITIEPIKGLDISALGAIQRMDEKRDKWSTYDHFNTTILNRNGTIWKWARLDVDYTAEYTINYNKQLGDHRFSLLGGYSYQMFTHRLSYIYAFDFATDNLAAWDFESSYAIEEGQIDLNADRNESKIIAFFGRATYNYQEKYLFLASLRREGCTKFGDDSKWGLFPAVSVGWRLNEEPFLENVSFINELKLRAGYGVTGVIPEDPYKSLPLLEFQDDEKSIYDGRIIKGVVPFQNYNPDLHWEEKHEINVGLDFAFLGNRLSGNFDVYQRTTKDLLYLYSVPVPPNLVTTTLANGATIKNKGFEVFLSGTPIIINKLRVDLDGNFSYNKSEITSLSSAVYSVEEIYAGWTGSPIQQPTHLLQVGEPVGNYYAYVVDSLSSQGLWYYKTADGESSDNPSTEDKQIVGNGIPKIFAGLNTTITYAGFDLYIGLRGAFKFQIYNQYRSHYENLAVLKDNNVPKAALEPQMNGNFVADDGSYSDYYIEDGDFVKIDNVSIGYSFRNVEKIYLNKLRIYASILNLHTFTKFKGLDPEVPFLGLSPGFETWDRYPKTTTYSVGINVIF